MGGVARTAILLADADVLIDFVKTQPGTLKLVSQHLGQLLVLEQVLETVDNLTKGQCTSLGIEVFTPQTEILLEAGAKRGGLSFEDRLGFVACRTHAWVMVTNDRALIRACTENGVPYRRGLRLVLDLVAGGHLGKRAAKQLVNAIHQVNPHHISAAVVRQFEEELLKL